MKNNIWQSYQPGQASSVLPPGYMEAATAPGRAIGQGIQSGLQSLAAGLQQRGMLQREDAKDAQKQAREAEKEAKDRAKEFDRIFEQGKYMGVWGEDAKTRSVEELAGQLQGAFQKEQMDAAKLADNLKLQQHETAMADRDERQRGIAAFAESMGMPVGVVNPNAGYNIAANHPAAAEAIFKLMPKQPDPNELKIGQLVEFPDGRIGHATTKNSVTLEALANEKPVPEIKFSPKGDFYHDGNAWKPVPFKEMKIDPMIWMTATSAEKAVMLEAFKSAVRGAGSATGGAGSATGGKSEMMKRFESWNGAK
jgi:hypothetical protein